jgi:hypothetical protein
MISVSENPTKQVLDQKKIESLSKSLEARLKYYAEPNQTMIETINQMEQDRAYNYPTEVFQYLREKYLQQETNYEKLVEYGTRWLDERGSKNTTFYEIFGVKDKQQFRQIFTKEAIIKASKELGLKIDREDREQKQEEPRLIRAYKEPVIENLSTEKLFTMAEKLGRSLEMLNEDKQATYLDNILPTQEFQQHLHTYPLQAVLIAASRNGFLIGKYAGSDPRYIGAYQANGIPVIAQPEVRQEIETRPEQIVPLEFLVQ